MDTMKVLLGATIALLLGALAVSWQSMKHGVDNASSDEVERLRKQISELRKEQESLDLQRKHQRELERLQATTPAAPTAANAELEILKQQVAAQQAALDAQEEQRKAKRDKDLDRDEEGLIDQHRLESKDAELRRARQIADALLVARVREYDKEAQFIVFESLMPQVDLQPGRVLGIRRKTGIAATFRISRIEAEGGIADRLPGFGNYEPQAGDELIIQID